MLSVRLTRFRVMIDRSVSDRISGNPICDATNIADKYRLKYCFEQGNHTVGDHASGGLAGCAKCDPPQVSVLESSGKCRCAQPIRMDHRLKSPSFTFFDRFRHEFFSLVSTMLNLSDSQVSIRELDWQAGPRLHILLFLFPLSTTFDDEEYERIFDTVASWEMSAVTEWKLSVIGPYDLLEFHKGELSWPLCWEIDSRLVPAFLKSIPCWVCVNTDQRNWIGVVPATFASAGGSVE